MIVETFRALLAASACLVLLHGAAHAAATTPAQKHERCCARAALPAQADRGHAFFTTRHGNGWSCAPCHGNPPTTPGKHASTDDQADVLAFLIGLRP